MAEVSIIIPCYNVESVVKRCIDSVKQQTFRDFSVYMIDDGSSDDTACVIQREIADDSRFRYIYKQNGGLSSARNTGLSFVDSPYVTFVDSDDFITENYIEKLLSPFFEEKIDLSAAYFDRIYEDHVSQSAFSEQDLILSKHPCAWAKMYKMSIIKDNHLQFPEGYWYEDLCFFNLYMKYVKAVKIIKKSLYMYIQNPNSIMYTYSDKIYDIYDIFDMISKNDPNNEIYEYIAIYHILVGTIFRASFKPDFNQRTIQDIYDFVHLRYPKWFKNKYIKMQMNIFYRTYLLFLKYKQFTMLYVILKMFNSRISL